MLRVTIKQVNAAFTEDGNLEIETARLLREVADRLENAETEGNLYDSNGNKVGEFKQTKERQ